MTDILEGLVLVFAFIGKQMALEIKVNALFLIKSILAKAGKKLVAKMQQTYKYFMSHLDHVNTYVRLLSRNKFR